MGTVTKETELKKRTAFSAFFAQSPEITCGHLFYKEFTGKTDEKEGKEKITKILSATFPARFFLQKRAYISIEEYSSSM